MLSASSRALPTSQQILPTRARRPPRAKMMHPKPFVVADASSSADSQDSDFNAGECAPEKEVGKPTIYLAESAISSETAGTSSDRSENTLAISAGLALISVAAASSILLQVGWNQPQVQTAEYSGPPLSYYMNKFKPAQVIEASSAPQLQTPSLSVEASVPQKPWTSSAAEASAPPVDQILSSF